MKNKPTLRSILEDLSLPRPLSKEERKEKIDQAIASIMSLGKPNDYHITCKYCSISHGIGIDGTVSEAKIHCSYAPEIDYTEQVRSTIPMSLSDGEIPCNPFEDKKSVAYYAAERTLDLCRPILLAKMAMIKFKRIEKMWKKNTPKGKEYIGYRFVPYTEKSKEGLVAMGYRIEPVYKCLPKKIYEDWR